MTLESLLRDVEQGVFPPAGGGLTVIRQSGQMAVMSFTGHVVVAADIEPAWTRRHLPPGELSEAFTPPFLGALATHTGRRVNAIDMLALGPPAGDAAAGPALIATNVEHPRVGSYVLTKSARQQSGWW